MFLKLIKSLTADRKLLKANPPLTSVTSVHHGVQCVTKFIIVVLQFLYTINEVKHSASDVGC
uniref:SFRICE_023627 n=1 Tax=Spodoptera frugiperda TaxID=7108 RepID=A0A2H1VY16_SPOFR